MTEFAKILITNNSSKIFSSNLHMRFHMDTGNDGEIWNTKAIKLKVIYLKEVIQLFKIMILRGHFSYQIYRLS